MSTVNEHYAHHLGPVYLWMAGGADAALSAGGAELSAFVSPLQAGSLVVDLGAGFGTHSIPLARRGMRVIAIDSCAELLNTMKALGGELPITRVESDLLTFQSHIEEPPAAILCMGDTITHLRKLEEVEALLDLVSAELSCGGLFVISLHDYSMAVTGDQRFIPVRSDDTRILTCFLEYERDAVVVHDILHERTPAGWRTQVSHYRKLRLSIDELTLSMRKHGFNVRRQTGVSGMVCLLAQLA